VIEVRALGPPIVLVDGEAPPRELLWRKNLALLLYLALSPGRRRAREHLVGMFWGDRTEAKARHSLNEALRVLRKAGGEDAVASEGDHVVLHADHVRVDAQDFIEALEGGDVPTAARLIRGPFMEGFFVEGSSGFEDWLHAERSRLGRKGVVALGQLGEQLLARGDGSGALDAAGRALLLDPHSEESARLALLAHALAGERARAVTLFEEFRHRLGEELGLKPSDELVALVERIREEKSWRLPSSMPDAERTARRAALVGRSEELADAVDTLYNGFAAGRPTLVILLGDPGVGKTRLADEILGRVRLRGVRTAGARAISADRAEPGATVRGLLRELEEGPAQSEPVQALEQAVRARLAERPLLLWIDDADLADPDSLTTVRRLLRDVRDLPLGILLGASRAPAAAGLDELRAEIGGNVEGKVIRLGPFTLEQVEELAAAVVPGIHGEARERLARRVWTDSAGLPLLALELLNAVRLGLELNRIEGTWPRPFQTLLQTFPGDLPDSVVAALRVSYRRLSPNAQQVLATSAVLGERVAVARLRNASDLPEDELASALDELEWQRWLTADARGYSFVAPIVRDVIARDMLTPGQKRRILVAAGLLDE
jgi:DNA-binding SARP family transcriptional activator